MEYSVKLENIAILFMILFVNKKPAYRLKTVFNNLGLLKTPCKRVKVSFAHHQSRDYSKYTAPKFRPSGYGWKVTHFASSNN